MNIAEEFERLMRDVAKETGRDINNLRDVALYAQERATHLSLLVGQPGFEEAVRAERDNVALRGGISVVQLADAVDARIVGAIQGVLSIGARALAAT